MKKFFRTTLAIVLAGGLLGIAACNKDYGDDVNQVRSDLTAALARQKAELEAAINEAKQAAAAAQAAAAQALEDAQDYADEAADAAKRYADEVAANAGSAATDESKAYADQLAANAVAEAQRLASAAQAAAEAYANQTANAAANAVKAELLTEIQNQVANCLSQAQAYADLAAQNAADAALATARAELAAEIATIEGRLDGIDSEINTLKETHDADINAIKATLGEYYNYIVALQEADAAAALRLDALETFQAEAEENIEQLASALAGMQQIFTEWCSSLEQIIEENHAELTGAIAGMQQIYDAWLNSHDEMIAALQDTAEELEEQIATNASAIAGMQQIFTEWLNSIDEEIVSINSEIDEIDEMIVQLTSSLAGIQQIFTDWCTSLEELIKTNREELQAIIDQNVADLEALIEGNHAEVTAAIAGMQQIYDAWLNSIDADIEEINAYLVSLEEKIGNRLTSISLIPELYVYGTPAIPVYAFNFNPLTVKVSDDATDEYYTPDPDTEASVSYKKTVVRYHVSPAKLTSDDIADPSYLLESAIDLKAPVANEYLSIDSWTVQEEELVVEVSLLKALPKMEDYETLTAAIEVPIAAKNLLEGETEAYVHSEYSKIYPVGTDLQIAAKIDDNYGLKGVYSCSNSKVDGAHYHYYDSFGAAKATGAVDQLDYNKTADLYDFVTGCILGDPDLYKNSGAPATEITVEELEAAGLAFRFAVPEVKWEINGDNQQDYAEIVDGHFVSPVGGTKAAGKSPIIRAEIYDVANDIIIDAAWFKIVWAMPGTEIEDPIKSYVYELGCDNFVGTITWGDFIDEVLSQVGDEGMSLTTFTDNYANGSISIKSDNDRAAGTIDLDFSTVADETDDAITWTISTAEIGSVINELLVGNEIKHEVTVTITPEDANFVGTISFPLEMTIELGDLPTIYDYEPGYWDIDGELFRIYPLQITDSYWVDVKGQTDYNGLYTVSYHYPLLQRFTKNADGNFIENMTDCGKYDIQFSRTQPRLPAGYVPEFAQGEAYAGDADATGYYLKNRGEGVSELTWYAAPGYQSLITDQNWYTLSDNIADVNVSLVEVNDIPTDAAKSLINDVRSREQAVSDYRNNVEDFKVVAFDIWATINEYNAYKVETVNGWFMNPLTFSATIDGEFTDAILDGSKVSVSHAFDSVLDCFGNKVNIYPGGRGRAEDLRVYYGVETPIWFTDEALISIDRSTNRIDNDLDPVANPEDAASMFKLSEKYTNASLTYDAAKQELVFLNVDGSAVTDEMYLYVPVQIGHKWGAWEQYAKIKLNPNPNAAAQN